MVGESALIPFKDLLAPLRRRILLWTLVNLLGQPHIDIAPPLLVLEHLQVGGIPDLPELDLSLPPAFLLLSTLSHVRVHVVCVFCELDLVLVLFGRLVEVFRPFLLLALE